MREVIEAAVRSLGRGFLRRARALPGDEFYGQLLDLAYRLLFLHAARSIGWRPPEVRALLEGKVRRAYDAFRSIERRWLPETEGIAASIDDRDFLESLHLLADVGSFEEAGTHYQSLMELHPVVSGNDFILATASGNHRKTSGSYYTPASLVECLLESALDPVLKSAADPAAVRICDPSCGSGQFLLTAVRRLSRTLDRRHAIQNMLYGVDLDPTAAMLCQMNLWLEMAAPDVPLSSLGGRIKCGNSLIGALREMDHPDAWGASLVEPTLDPDEVARVARDFRFFHWPLEFPEVYAAGGFDVVLGNPPWERNEVTDKEWFARRVPEIAAALNSDVRKRMIEDLAGRSPHLVEAFRRDRSRSAAESRFIRQSGRYPSGAHGNNRYAAFTETMRRLIRPGGRVGCIVPSGIATDDSTRELFGDLMRSRMLSSLYHFDNRSRMFPEVGSNITFCLLTMSAHSPSTEFVCFAHTPRDLQDASRRFAMSADDLALFNPNTRTLPIFRSQQDARLSREIYRKCPVLVDRGGRQNFWKLRSSMLFQMSGDSPRFRTRTQLEAQGWTLEGNVFRKSRQVYLPLYEAKLMHQYDHRWATYDGFSTRVLGADETHCLPRYWILQEDVDERLADRRWERPWLLGFRDVCRSTDERSVIACFLPRVGVGHTCMMLFPQAGRPECLLANLNAFVLDYVARQKIGGIHLTFSYLHQLPILPPSTYDIPCPWQRGVTLAEWIAARVLELSYTTDDLRPLAQDLGYAGPPFAWDESRRVQLRCELDAAYFHLYAVPRSDVEYMLGTFPIVARKEQRRYGEFRSRRAILEIYDAMREAIARGRDPSALRSLPA